MQRRMLAVVAVASVAAAGPIAAAQGASSRAKPTSGVVYGGVLSVVESGVSVPGFPVLIELSKTGRKVVRASIGLDLKCQMPGSITIPDFVDNLPVSSAGKFRAEQPLTHLDANPAQELPPLDISAKITGTVNRTRTKIKGTWQRRIVIYDATGANVIDTCDTGVLSFTAKN